MATVEDLYKQTKSVMFEEPTSTSYDQFLIGNTNRVIRELFEENNMARMSAGKAPLKEVPYIQTRTNELTYEEVYVNEVMPLGLAAYFFLDDDLNKYKIYLTDYNNSRIKNQKVVSQETIDELA